jgi:hypothetical protein
MRSEPRTMTPLRRNRDLYGSREFDLWMRRAALDADEYFAITTYLDRAKRTLSIFSSFCVCSMTTPRRRSLVHAPFLA